MAAAAAAAAAGLFPLRTLGDVRDLFARQLASPDPDLALLSVVAGALENQWTQAKAVAAAGSTTSSGDGGGGADPGDNPCQYRVEPPLEWSTVDALVAKFDGIVRGYCDVTLLEKATAERPDEADTRRLIKHVADIVWNTLSKSHYKDRPHLQSIFSYLTGNKLDCFGVAFAVVAACQLLGARDVHLALSEDHAWVVFGPDGTCTAEVTWHGKGNEDKRGQPVDIEKARASWLYLGGQPVVCDRHLEVAAMVSSINFSITASMDSIECGAMQQELLWLLYDRGHLKNYPMALGNLGDLEEISASLGRPSCSRLFSEAIEASQKIYANHHVYPYTYQAGFFYRDGQLKKALESWAGAADAIKIYRYSKDDEEIYKEFMEIANELIPHLVKKASLNPKDYNAVLRDPGCFASILKFYDGICCWEEDSATPVLHIGWAKPMVSTCMKFEADVRSCVEIPKDETESKREVAEIAKEEGGMAVEDVSGGIVEARLKEEEDDLVLNNNYYRKNKFGRRDRQRSVECGETSGGGKEKSCDSRNGEEGEGQEEIGSKSSKSEKDDDDVEANDSSGDCRPIENVDSVSAPGDDGEDGEYLKENCDRVRDEKTVSKVEAVNNEILVDILSDGCSENLLNLDYLMGKPGCVEPFLVLESLAAQDFLSNPTKAIRKKQRALFKRGGGTKRRLNGVLLSGGEKQEEDEHDGGGGSKASKIFLKLHSAKMRGLKDLLCSEKLNTSAIQLQLTAQSQTDVSSSKDLSSSAAAGTRPKRARRE